MNRIGCLLSGLAVVALVLTVLLPSLVWFAALLLILALYGLVANQLLYRPPEDHLGVIYRFDRFERWVRPDEWIVRIPWVDVERAPVNLQIRQTPVQLPDLVTQDQVPVSCEVLVAFQTDPREAEPSMVPQLLGFSRTDWDSVLATTLHEVAIQVVAGMAFLRLFSGRGLRELKEALGTRLSEQVRPLGLIIVPRSGVTVQTVKTTDAVRDAMIERYAAPALGAAALARVRPMLTELEQGEVDNAWNTLLLAWGATIVQGGSPPSIVVTAAGDGHGNGHGQMTLPDGLREMVSEAVASATPNQTQGGTTRRAQPRARSTQN